MKKLRTSAKFKIYKAVRRAVCASHPLAFPSVGRRPPLAEGIGRELIDRHRHALSANNIRVFLRIWTRSTAYLASVSAGSERVDLDGAPQGRPADSHRAEAAAKLKERRAGRHNVLLTKTAVVD